MVCWVPMVPGVPAQKSPNVSTLYRLICIPFYSEQAPNLLFAVWGKTNNIYECMKKMYILKGNQFLFFNFKVINFTY